MMVNLPCLKESCPNFLRPTCSYTECQLSFLTGSCPTESTTASYSFEDYQKLEFATSEHIFFGKDQNALRVIEGFDVI